jgi:outer membrane protein
MKTLSSSLLKSLVRPLVIASLLASTAWAVAQETKIGFVNRDRLFRESQAAQQATAKLEAEFSRREKDMQDIANRLKAASEKFEKDQPTLSESQRTARTRELVEQDRDFQRKQREFSEDLNARRNEELQAVLERANRVIKEIAEREKFDIILQEGVYVSTRIDITERVLRALNAAR